MQNIRVTSNTLTDGSRTFAVKFEATHGDNTQHTVTLECYSEGLAVMMTGTLSSHVAYAETDATR